MSSNPVELSLDDIWSYLSNESSFIELTESWMEIKSDKEVRIKTAVRDEDLITLLAKETASEEFNDTYFDIDSTFPLLSHGLWLFTRTFFPPNYRKEWHLKICNREDPSILQWKEIRGREKILSFFQQCLNRFQNVEYLEMMVPKQVMHFGVSRYFLDPEGNNRIDICGSDREPMAIYVVRSSNLTDTIPCNLAPSKTQAMLSVLNPKAFEAAFPSAKLEAIQTQVLHADHPMFDPCEKVLELRSSAAYRESFFQSSSSDSESDSESE